MGHSLGSSGLDPASLGILETKGKQSVCQSGSVLTYISLGLLCKPQGHISFQNSLLSMPVISFADMKKVSGQTVFPRPHVCHTASPGLELVSNVVLLVLPHLQRFWLFFTDNNHRDSSLSFIHEMEFKWLK